MTYAVKLSLVLTLTSNFRLYCFCNMISSQEKVRQNGIWTHAYKNEIQAEGKPYIGIESRRGVKAAQVTRNVPSSLLSSLPKQIEHFKQLTNNVTECQHAFFFLMDCFVETLSFSEQSYQGLSHISISHRKQVNFSKLHNLLVAESIYAQIQLAPQLVLCFSIFCLAYKELPNYISTNVSTQFEKIDAVPT